MNNALATVVLIIAAAVFLLTVIGLALGRPRRIERTEVIVKREDDDG